MVVPPLNGIRIICPFHFANRKAVASRRRDDRYRRRGEESGSCASLSAAVASASSSFIFQWWLQSVSVPVDHSAQLTLSLVMPVRLLITTHFWLKHCVHITFFSGLPLAALQRFPTLFPGQYGWVHWTDFYFYLLASFCVHFWACYCLMNVGDTVLKYLPEEWLTQE